MPGCVNCDPSPTPIAIRGEGRVLTTGSGTASDPLVIALKADASSFSLTVQDTDSVNLTIFGTGSDDDPYVLSADAGSAFKLTDLGDVDSPAPVDGQVPTWVGSTANGHWEFLSPQDASSGAAATIDASDLTQGILDNKRLRGVMVDLGTIVGDWNAQQSSGVGRVIASQQNLNAPVGYYNYGTLVVYASGNSVSQMYFEHGTSDGANPPVLRGRGNIWWRTKWNAADWSTWATTARIDANQYLTNSDALSVATGYPLQSAFLSRSGNLVTVSFTVTSSAPITNAGYPTGNFPNKFIGTIPAIHAPKQGVGAFTTADQGLTYSGYVDTSGAVYLSSMTGGIATTAGASITTTANTPVSLAGTWVAKELVS